MSNTNMMKHEQYNVDDAWPIEEPATVDDCLKKLVILSHSGNKIECHGASMLKYEGKCSIRSKFDIRFFNKNNKNKHPKEKEKNLLESFVKKADPHFPPEARRFIEVARLKWNTLYNTGTMFIGRHYRLPTRCIDWTMDPFIALFFACCDAPKKHGVIWWMDYDVFSYAIAKQWPYFYNKYEKIEEDFEKDFTEDKDRDILLRFHYQCFLDRPIKQKAYILLSGKYNVHHDKKIYDLGVRKCGRIVIRSEIKQKLLDKLNLWGINNTTLGIEDSYVDKIVADVADEILGKIKKGKIKKSGKKPLQGYFPGGKVIYADYKGKEYKAWVYSNGRIKVNGEIFESPSLAGLAITKKRTMNGWRFWKYKDKNGELVYIDKLRK